MRLATYILFLLSTSPNLFAQTYTTDQATITFYAPSPVEDIKATNSKTTIFFSPKKQKVAIKIQNDEFQFRMKLMERQFNKSFMESHKYPYSTFHGSIVTPFDPETVGIQKATIIGKLSIHGRVRTVNVPAELYMQNGAIVGRARFTINTRDYNITPPSILGKEIASQLQVKVNFTLEYTTPEK